MNNSFGAKITQPMPQAAWQSYFVSLENKSLLTQRNKTVMAVEQLCEQLMMVDSGVRFLFVVANDSQAERIRKLTSVKAIGAVNIDMKRFQALVSGEIYKK